MSDLQNRLRAAADLADDPADRVASVQRRAARLRTRRAVAAAGGTLGMAGALATFVVVTTLPRSEPPAIDDVAPLVGTQVPATSSPASPATVGGPDLDARYDACVRARGFDPGGVQVLLWVARLGRPTTGPAGPADPEVGAPWWVKTGRDVPAAIHRPCLVAIGGADPHMSSHGNPES
ncbi:MAG TPA: hypothetical protein VNA20_09015 [Frankiaceae bacterium]|nr:hypothetical protein [Frankiaceae bacterium]